MTTITHYWTLINPMPEPGVVFLLSDNTIMYGTTPYGVIPSIEKLRIPKYGFEMPEVIHGVNPDNTSEPMDFGEWSPIKNWTRDRSV